MSNCISENIYRLGTQQQRCDFVNQNCPTDNLFNYHKLHFCYLDERLYLTIPLLSLLIVIKFNIVSHISDDYLAQAVAKVSKYLKLSEAVAGATLLSLCNGVSDFITVVLAALHGGSDDNDLAIGSLFGASLFTCTVVFGRTVIASSGQTVENLDKGNSIQDMIFFIIGMTIFLVLGSLNTYMIITGASLLGVYLVYLYLLIRKDNIDSEQRSKDKELKKLAAAEVKNQQNGVNYLDLPDKENPVESNENSAILEESVLPEDEKMMEKHSFLEIMLKIKKRVSHRWTSTELIGRILFFIEYPFEVLMYPFLTQSTHDLPSRKASLQPLSKVYLPLLHPHVHHFHQEDCG